MKRIVIDSMRFALFVIKILTIHHYSTVSHLDTRRARSQADRSKSTKLAFFEHLRLKSKNTKLYQTDIFWKNQKFSFTDQLKVYTKILLNWPHVRISKAAKDLRCQSFMCAEEWQSNLFEIWIIALLFLENTKQVLCIFEENLNFKPYSLLGAKFEFWGWTFVSL